ncbi:MAG: S-layer family protein, partial [Rhodocyclaceae bacterium]|nr:S-layer family protein [Rhodocyclaceae bacterium]
ENSGIISTPQGKLLLAAGYSLEITSLDFEGVSFEVQAPSNSVLNLGQLLADGGAVQGFAGSLRHSGEIRAGRMATDADGSVRLVATGELVADAASRTSAATVLMQSSAGTTRVAGKIDASNDAGQGGHISILGRQVALEPGADLNASGSNGGGQIRVGGDYQGANAAVQNAERVYVGQGTRLAADALGNGNGGRVIVWADDQTRYYGSLSARGGPLGGNGGFAEVSGKNLLQFDGSADLSAPHGLTGTLLLDPLDVLLADFGGLVVSVVDAFSDFARNVVTISPSALNNVRASVTVQARRDVYINSAVALTTAGAGFTAQAAADATNFPGGRIALNANISTAGGAVTLSGAQISGSGSISTAGGAISETATGSISHNGAVNAGAGALTLNAEGSIQANALTGGTVTLNAGSSIFAGVDAATRLDMNAGSNFISVFTNTGPMRVGTITGGTVVLSSSRGFEQVAGGAINASFADLLMNGSSGTVGSAAAPINVNSANLEVDTDVPFHLAIPAGVSLNTADFSGPVAALGASTLTGSSNLTSFALGSAGGALTANLAASGGFGNALSLNARDGGINVTALNLAGGSLFLSAQGAVTVNNGSVGTLNVFTSGNPFTSTGTLTSTATLVVQTSGGNITTANVNAGTGLFLFASSGSIATGNVTSAGNVNFSSGLGGITAGNISSAGNINLSSNGTISAGTTSSSGSSVSVSACNTNTCSGGLNLAGASAQSAVFLSGGFGPVNVSGAVSAGSSININASQSGINLATVNSTSGSMNVSARDDIVFDSISLTGASQFGTPLVLNSQQGAIRTRNDNSAYDISADGALSLSAGTTLGNTAFAHPLDIQAGQSFSSNTPGASLSAGGSAGTAANPLVVHLTGSSQRSIVASAGTSLNIAVQNNDATPVADSLTGLGLTLSAAGIGSGNSAHVSSQNLSLNIASDGATLTLPDVVQTSGQFDFFRLNSDGGLNIGAMQLASSGANAVTLNAAGNLIQAAGGGQTVNGIQGGTTSVAADGNLSIAGTVSGAGNVALSAGGNLSVGTALDGFGDVQASGTLTIAAGSDLHAANLASTSNMNVSAGGLAQIGNASTSGGFGHISMGAMDIDAQAISSSRNVSIGATTLSAGAISAGNDLTLDLGAVGTLATGNISGQRHATISSSGNLDLGSLQVTAGTGTLSLNSGGSLTIGPNALADAPDIALSATDAISAHLNGSALRELTLNAGGTFNVTAAQSLQSLAITAQGERLGASSGVSAGGGAQTFTAAFDGGSTTTLNLAADVEAPMNFSFFDVSGTAGRQLVLASLVSFGGSIDVGMATGNIGVTSIASSGGDIHLNASNGGIFAVGAGSINAGDVGGGTTSAEVSLHAENGAAGTAGSPLSVTNALTVAIAAHDDIGLNIDAGAIHLDIAAAAAGSGGIAIQADNFPGFTLTRASGELVLGPVVPTTRGNFALTSTDGGIRVNGLIDVNTLTLDAQGGDLVLANGAARSIHSAGFIDLHAQRDIIARAGADAGENVDIAAGNFLNLTAGHDILLVADGGSVMAAASGGSSQSASAGNNILVQGGRLAGAFAKLAGNDDFSISAGNDISILGGGGNGAFADVHGGTASSSSFQSLSAHNLTVQGGNGDDAFGALRGGTQSITGLTGAVLVAGGGGAGAYALIESTQGFQSIGRTSSFSGVVPTASITVQGGAGGVSGTSSNAAFAALRGRGQNILSAGDIRVTGGPGTNATAEINSQSNFQSVGSDSFFFNDPTNHVVVQGGTGSGASAQIFSSNGQTVLATLDISVLAGNVAGTSARIVTGGSSQQVGSFSTQRVVLAAGQAADTFAEIALTTAGTGSQFVRSAQGISLTAGNGDNAYAGISATGSASQNVNTSGSLSLSGGTGGSSSTQAGALIETANGNQNVTASALTVVSGAGFADAGLTTNGGGAQTIAISGNIDIGTSAGNNSGTNSGIAALGGGNQSVSAGGTLFIHNDHGADLVGILAVGGGAGQTQQVQAGTLTIVNHGSAGRAGLHSDGSQVLNVTGTCADASCGISVIGAGGGSAEISAGADQTITADVGGSNPYAGSSSVRVGSTTASGASTISAGGTLTLIAADLTVQGGNTAAAQAKVLAGGDINMSTLTGGIAVLGGSAGSASIDPNLVDLVANGSIDTTGGSSSTATATITAGTLSMAATNGRIFVTGGAAPASVSAVSTADIVTSGDLGFVPNASDASLDAASGGTVSVGGACINCTSGLRGGSFAVNVIPVVQEPTVEVPIEAAVGVNDVVAATESSFANADVLNAQLEDLNGSSAESTELNRRGSQCR